MVKNTSVHRDCALLLSLFALVSAASARASDGGRGKVSAGFLSVNPSVRLAGLGGTQAAADGGADAMFANPAGLSSLDVPELWLSHTNSFLDTSFQSGAIGYPRGNDVFGFAFQYLNDGEVDRIGIDAGNQPITGNGQFRPYAMVGQGAWSRTIERGGLPLALGGSLKLWSEHLDRTSTRGWAADLGVRSRRILMDGISLGVVARNLGPSRNGFPLPGTVAVGAAYDVGRIAPEMTGLSLLGEYDLAFESDAVARLGLEFNRSRFWVRGGFQTLASDEREALSQFSFGGGLRIRKWRVDYAWIPRGALGDQHRIGMSLSFGMTPEEREMAARELDRQIALRMRQKAEAHLKRGGVALEAGDFQGAVEEFNQVLQWDAENAEAQRQMFTAKEKLRARDAEELYQEGVRYSAEGQWIDATFHWKQALKVDAGHEAARQALLDAERRTAGGSAAMTGRESVIEIAYNKGVLFYLDGDYKAALDEWEKVLKAEPSRPQLREYMAKAKAHQLEEELASLRAARPSPEEEIEMLSRKAYTFYMLGDTDKAVEAWTKILTMSPENADATWALRLVRQQGPVSTAGSDTSRTIEELNTAALQSYGNGDLRRAIATWRRALVLAPDNAKVRSNLKRAESELIARKTGEGRHD